MAGAVLDKVNEVVSAAEEEVREAAQTEEEEEGAEAEQEELVEGWKVKATKAALREMESWATLGGLLLVGCDAKPQHRLMVGPGVERLLWELVSSNRSPGYHLYRSTLDSSRSRKYRHPASESILSPRAAMPSHRVLWLCLRALLSQWVCPSPSLEESAVAISVACCLETCGP